MYITDHDTEISEEVVSSYTARESILFSNRSAFTSIENVTVLGMADVHKPMKLKRFTMNIAPYPHKRKSVLRAIQYRKQYGEPADNIQNLLEDFIDDDDLWEEILNTPYG